MVSPSGTRGAGGTKVRAGRRQTLGCEPELVTWPPLCDWPGCAASADQWYMINTQPGPNGRSAGSLTWAGIYNTYYWLDPQKRVAGVFLTQILPFADDKAVALYGEFEHGVY